MSIVLKILLWLLVRVARREKHPEKRKKLWAIAISLDSYLSSSGKSI